MTVQRWMCVLATLTVLGICPMATQADDWPQFRGKQRDNISQEKGLYRKWPEGGPKVVWTTNVCQGYAAPAIVNGRVYLNDYDEEAKTWLVRCFTLADGKELWQFKEKRTIRPNHGITRTVPTVDGNHAFSLDPKCVLHCLNAADGKELWRKNLVKEYKARIPPWYNGQCPLMEEDRIVIGIGGDALMAAFDKATGKEIWRTPNSDAWPLSHASVMPATLCGQRQYLWCTLKGLLGVSADDGRLLWTFPRKFNTALGPSPIAIDDSRVFMTSCYDSGSVMIRVKLDGTAWSAEHIFELSSSEWNSEVHTPIIYDNHLFAVGRKKRGLFTCLDFNGKEIWTSQAKATFDLGSFLLADGMFYILDGKTGMLRLVEANTTEYRELDTAQLLNGHDVWSPISLSDGKMIIRDMAKLICIEVGPTGRAHKAVGHPAPVGASSQVTPKQTPQEGSEE